MALYVANDGGGVLRTYDLVAQTMTRTLNGALVLTRNLTDAEKVWVAQVVAQQQNVDGAAQRRADLVAAMPALTTAAAGGDPVATAVLRLTWLATTDRT